MPYIGNNLATQFQAFATQTITGDGSTGYTLDRAVANGKELLVYINNVKQEEGSGKSYEASGTTITFSEAVASGDSCYLVYMGSAQQTVTAPAGSIVSSQFSSADIGITGSLGVGTTSPHADLHIQNQTGTNTGSTELNLWVNDDRGRSKFNLKSTDDGTSVGTFKLTTESTVPSNTDLLIMNNQGIMTVPNQPAFLARKSSDTSNIAVDTAVTIVFDTEVFDQNADYNNSNGIFTAPVTGRYQINAMVYMGAVPNDANYFLIELVASNRSVQDIFRTQAGDAEWTYQSFQINILLDMDASDTAKINVYQPNGTAQADIQGHSTHAHTSFSGYLVA